MRRIPAVMGPDRFILTIAQMFAGQAVMLDVVDQLQLPDRYKGLPDKQPQTGPTPNHQRQKNHCCLKRPIAKKWVA